MPRESSLTDSHPTYRATVELTRVIDDVVYRNQQSAHPELLNDDLARCVRLSREALDTLAAPPASNRQLNHNLRNQLGNIAGYSELMLEEHASAIGHELRDALSDLLSVTRSALDSLAQGNRSSARRPKSAPGKTQTTETGTLLVIDDAKQSRELLARFLKRKGHDVITASSGPEALAILQQQAVDLALLDLQMPDMSGIEVLETIKRDAVLRALPVIIVSGMQDTDDVVACIDAGAEDYLYKPFNATMLQARLNACLQRKRWHDREQAYRRELERNQRFIRNTFGRYLSDAIVDELLESPSGLNMGGSKRTVTILMCDIRNFTTICEHSDPERIVDLLNNYLGSLSEIIMRHGGTVDEFIGDAILALFGAPVTHVDDAERAVRAALDMQAEITKINRHNGEQGLPEISIGIGLHSGEVVAGNIGSERRSKYAVVGHNVNLTARIESYTNGGEILISESTLNAVGPRVHTGRQLTAQPKGMADAVTVYAVTGIDSD